MTVLVQRAASALIAFGVTAPLFLAAFDGLRLMPLLHPSVSQARLIYVTAYKTPATHACGIWDGVDSNGMGISGIVFCSGPDKITN